MGEDELRLSPFRCVFEFRERGEEHRRDGLTRGFAVAFRGGRGCLGWSRVEEPLEVKHFKGGSVGVGCCGFTCNVPGQGNDKVGVFASERDHGCI